MAVSFDDYEERFNRYKSAIQEVMFYSAIFEQAYRLALPTRNRWMLANTEILDKSAHHWDSTAIEGLQQFASNMQGLLMPIGQKWFRYVPGPEFENPNERLIVEQKLQKHSDFVLRILQASNLNLEANLAIQDAGISTGLLQIKIDKDNKHNPISFEAIPMHEVALGEYNGKIENVWRKFAVPVRDIKTLWPMAELGLELGEILKYNPNQRVELIESTIIYPNNPEHSRYLYTISHHASKTDIIFEPRSWSPWIPFRFNMAIGETWGSGPVRSGLAVIRMANMISEFEITHAGYNVPRPLMVDGSSILNPNTLKMRPGMILPVNDVRTPPLVPLELTGNLQFDQLVLSQLQQQIRDMLFADPLGPTDQQKQTATEIQVRQQNAIKRNAAAFSRMEAELVYPIIRKTTELLNMHDMLPDFFVSGNRFDFKVDGEKINVDFDSPLNRVQKNEDLQAMQTFYQSLAAIFGQQAVLVATNVAKFPQLLAEKLNIPLELVKSEDEVTAIIQALTQPPQQPPQPQPMATPQQVQQQSFNAAG